MPNLEAMWNITRSFPLFCWQGTQVQRSGLVKVLPSEGRCWVRCRSHHLQTSVWLLPLRHENGPCTCFIFLTVVHCLVLEEAYTMSYILSVFKKNPCLKIYLLILERKGDRERNIDGRETSMWEKHQLAASHTCSNQGSNLQPRYTPWPGIKPTNFWCTRQCSFVKKRITLKF